MRDGKKGLSFFLFFSEVNMRLELKQLGRQKIGTSLKEIFCTLIDIWDPRGNFNHKLVSRKWSKKNIRKNSSHDKVIETQKGSYVLGYEI